MRVHEVRIDESGRAFTAEDLLPGQELMLKKYPPARYARCCGTCEYWDDHSDAYPPDATRWRGECRRYAPRAVTAVLEYQEGIDEVYEASFPLTWNDTWCGEWALSADAEPLEEEE